MAEACRIGVRLIQSPNEVLTSKHSHIDPGPSLAPSIPHPNDHTADGHGNADQQQRRVALLQRHNGRPCSSCAQAACLIVSITALLEAYSGAIGAVSSQKCPAYSQHALTVGEIEPTHTCFTIGKDVLQGAYACR